MNAPLAKLRELIKKNKLDSVLISSHSNIVYLTNYSGFSKEEREAFLFITRLPTPGTGGQAQNQQYILTDGRYTQDVKTLIPDFQLIEISSKNSLKEIFKELKTKHKIKKLRFEGHDISFLEHQKLSKYFNNIYHLSLSRLRSIKTPDEISRIEKACKLGDKTFAYILKKIKLGISEKELAVKIEIFIKENLADISFSPIVAFGANSAIPHHVPSDKRLAISDKLVLLDFGVKLNNYCSDMTRSVFFGKAPAEFKKIYNTVLKAQQKAIQQFNNLTIKQSAIKASEIDKIARDYITSQDYPTISHSLGHGIGLEVHEAPHLSPKSKDILKEGMVFSIEPGIYIPKLGGVRIEDLAVLEKEGVRLLTHSPKNLIEI